MLLNGRTVPFIVLIVTGFVVSCSTIEPRFAPPPSGAEATAVFYARWVDWLGRFDATVLQDGCRPALIEPRPDVPYRGTVVLVHDITACPQQFFELADLLALRGYRSFLPLLPGHGRVQPGAGRVGGLPTARDVRRRYEAFAAVISGIMAYAPGDRVIGGNGAGAAVSLMINGGAPGLYDRHIVWSPSFTPGERTAEATRACLRLRARGRAGYCDIDTAPVMTALAPRAEQMLRDGPGKARLQIVTTAPGTMVAGMDHAVACAYPAEVPPSMLSVFDNPGVDMYWLDSLLSGTIDFIVDGLPLPIGFGRNMNPSGLPECALSAERAD